MDTMAYDNFDSRPTQPQLRLLIDSIPLFDHDVDDEREYQQREQGKRRRWVGSANSPAKRKGYRAKKRVEGPAGERGIQKWACVKEVLEEIVGGAGILAAKSSGAKEEDDDEDVDAETLGKLPHNATASPNLNITIPHGFQPVRSIPPQRPIIKNVLYIPPQMNMYNLSSSSEAIVVLDEAGVVTWRGERGKRILEAGLGTWVSKGVAGWKWIDKGFAVVAGGDMCLRVLDIHFQELCVVSNSKPILFLDWIPEKNELVTGEVGNIKFWTLEVHRTHQREILKPKLVRTIADLADEEWVQYVSYDRTEERCFAAVDTSVYIYDWNTGERLETLRNIHEMSLSCLAYYEPMEYLITGSKDGKIKVWSPQYLLIHTFEHLSSVTTLLLVEEGAQAAPGTVPVVLSGSTDGTVRLWEIERGGMVYRMNAQQEVFGLRWLRKDVFMMWGKRAVGSWALNRYCETFAYFRTAPKSLVSLPQPDKPTRLLTTLSDGSLKLLSPVTGAVLVTCFPVYKDVTVKHAVGDMASGTVYGLLSSGEIGAWDVKRNPAVLKGIWDNVVTRDRLTCISGMDIYNHIPHDGVDDESGFMQKFYLAVGMESGGVGWIAEQGKLEGSVQAHAAEVVFVRFDAKRLWLLSGGKDNTIKIWAFSAAESSKLTHLHTLSTHPYTPTSVFALAIGSHAIGVPESGGIAQWNYQLDGIVRRKEMKEREGEVSALCVCEAWRIWAGAVGRSVRVWDQTGLIREIQFHEKVHSVCFANAWGDLLVCLSDQISLVRIQDYLPLNILKLAASHEFVDEDPEEGLPFDSGLDFWEGVYDRDVRENGSIGYWHVKKGESLLEPVSVEPPVIDEDTFQGLEQRRQEAIKRRNRRIFLEQERRAFANANRFEGTKIGWTTKSDESAEEDEDYVLIRHAPSEAELVELIRAESPTEGLVTEKVPPIAYVTYKAPASRKKARYLKSGEKRKRANAVLKPPPPAEPPISKEAIEAKRANIRKTLQNQGVAMPNSTVTEEVGVSRKEGAPIRRRPTIRPPVAEVEPPPVKYVVPPSRGRIQRQRRKEPGQDDAGKQHKPSSLAEPVPFEEEPPQQEIQDTDEDDIPPPPSPPIFEDKEVLRARRKRKGKPKKGKKRTKIKVPTSTKSDQQVPPAPPKKTVREYKRLLPHVVIVQPPPLPATPPTEPITPRAPTIVPVVSHVKKHAPNMPVPKISDPQVAEPPPIVVAHPEEKKGLVTDRISVVRISQVESKAAARFAWDLIRAREFSVDDDIPEGLRKLMGMFWFPQLKGKQVTLQNIVAALLQLLESGLWLEKVEASKALLFLYHTFRTDFMDPMATLVRPQLDFLRDENWQVRAHLCANIAQYGLVNEEILAGLIGRLADENDYVRSVAMRSLGQCGVNNKDDLRAVMIECGMLPNLGTKMASTILDNLMANAHLQKEFAHGGSTEIVQAWFRRLQPKSIGHIYGRRDSYYEHLAGPFFPPDARSQPRRAAMSASQGMTGEELEFMDEVVEGWATQDGHDMPWLGKAIDWEATFVRNAVVAATASVKAGEREKGSPPLTTAIRKMRPLTAGARLAQGGLRTPIKSDRRPSTAKSSFL